MTTKEKTKLDKVLSECLKKFAVFEKTLEKSRSLKVLYNRPYRHTFNSFKLVKALVQFRIKFS